MAKKKTATEWFNEGDEKHNAGDFDGAIKSYDEAIKLNPDYTAAYNDRGIAWKNKKEYDKAIENYNKAIELDPNSAEAYNNRGNVWGDKEEYNKALEDFNKAIELNPNDAELYNNRGIAWKNKKEYDAALKDYNKALELNPNFIPAIHNRGVAIALQEAEKLRGQFTVDVDDLKERAKEEKEKAGKAGKYFNWLLVVFGVICAFFTLFIMISLPSLSSNIYLSIAVASAFGIISFPFIWGLKQLKATEARHIILSETFESLAFIEPRINFFGGQDLDWQKAMYEIYITHRIKEGPEKLLLDLYQQKSDRPPATTPAEILDRIIDKKE